MRTEHPLVHYRAYRQLFGRQPVVHLEQNDQLPNGTGAHRHRKRRILRSRIRKIGSKIRIPSGSTRRLHFLGNRRRALIFRHHGARFQLLLRGVPLIPHRPQSGRSLRQIRGGRHRVMDTGAIVRQHGRKSQYRPAYVSHAPVRQLRRLVAHVAPHRHRNTFEYLPPCPLRIADREPPGQGIREFPNRVGRYSATLKNSPYGEFFHTRPKVRRPGVRRLRSGIRRFRPQTAS